jgi:hypothetical protein
MLLFERVVARPGIVPENALRPLKKGLMGGGERVENAFQPKQFRANFT